MTAQRQNGQRRLTGRRLDDYYRLRAAGDSVMCRARKNSLGRTLTT